MKTQSGHFLPFLLNLIRNRVIFLAILTLLISFYAAVIYPAFSSPFNLKGILLNMSMDALVGIGMMLLLISGAFDLSVGSVLALSGAVAANLMAFHDINTWLAVVAGLMACLGVGLFNGLLVAKVGVNPLIATLATMLIVRGIVYIVAGTGIIDLTDDFLKIADNTFLGLRIPIWYMIIATIIFSFLVSKTEYFRKYYYIGCNEKAALLSGINVVRMRIISFVIIAGLAGIAGLVVTSRLGTAISASGKGLEFRVITAAVLGGASLFGGQGSILGVVLGALFLGLVNNVMIIAQTSIYWQNVVTGSILIAAVTIDALLKRGFPK